MSETPEPRRRRHRRRPQRPAVKPRPVVTAILAGFGLVLGGAVVVHAGLQTGRLAPTPVDQVTQAQAVIFGPEDQRDFEKGERLARQALARQPLQARAASLLAVIKQETGDEASATRLMKATAGLSRRDDVADYWLFDHHLKAGNFEAAALHADALLRREPIAAQDQLHPPMVAAFANEAFANALAVRLAKNPPWRGRFLEFANANLQNPRAPYVIFSAIQKAGGRPTPEELAPYFMRLLAAGNYDEAYLSWVLFLPQDTVAKMQNVYDGDFEGWMETPPFGWNFIPGIRGSMERSDAYGRPGMAMRLDYDGVTTPTFPSQILLLSPARYKLTGLVLTATPKSPGRVAVSVVCDKGETLLPQIPVPDTKGTWRAFSGEFTVPETCKGQVLTITPLPSGERSTVEVWFDQFAINRVDTDS